MAPSRLSSALTLLALLPFAVSLSVRVPSVPPAIFGKDCTTISQPGGGKLISCPGCTRIIDKDGNTVLKSGPKCPEDDDDDKKKEDSMDILPHIPSIGTSSCATMLLPNSDIVMSCPRCQRIASPTGNIITEAGGECHLYSEFVHPTFGIDAQSAERCGTMRPGLDRDGGETLLDCLGCRKFVDEFRRTHMECPGCRKIINAQGYVIYEYGHKCREYENDVPVFGGREWRGLEADEDEGDEIRIRYEGKEEDEGTRYESKYDNEHHWASGWTKDGEPKESDSDGCSVVRRGGQKRLVMCSGCVRVFDADGYESFRTGWKCKNYGLGWGPSMDEAALRRHSKIHEPEDVEKDNLEL